MQVLHLSSKKSESFYIPHAFLPPAGHRHLATLVFGRHIRLQLLLQILLLAIAKLSTVYTQKIVQFFAHPVHTESVHNVSQSL